MTHGLTDDPNAHTWERLGLGGATQKIAYPSPVACKLAVLQLMSDGHGHHFAVVDEGTTLVCSEMAASCLLDWYRAKDVPL